MPADDATSTALDEHIRRQLEGDLACSHRMAGIPSAVDETKQPPMTVPLRHFLVGLAFLCSGVALVAIQYAGVTWGFGALAEVHIFLAGWICITIMGAMTQFVPVWSGVPLYSRRLASLQLVLVTGGLSGYVAALLVPELAAVPLFGAVLLAGFWVFVSNIVMTLRGTDGLDITEAHFLVALCFFLILTVLGLLLALDFTAPLIDRLPVKRANVRLAHATLGVFGAVLTTVYGALYQLATMFTQTNQTGLEVQVQRAELLCHPLGVVLLAGGRLAGAQVIATMGGVLVAGSALAVGAIVLRKLIGMNVAWTPMHRRYAVVAVMLPTWALMTLPVWGNAPLDEAFLLGAPGSAALLGIGVIALVVFGTLYHIIPFIVWVDRYSDRVGLEPVPMVDDLYSGTLAHIDGGLLGAGTGLFFLAERAILPAGGAALAGLLVCAGALVFSSNMLLVLHRHSVRSLGEILLGVAFAASIGLGSD
jgi:hypothetical protein